MKIAIRMRDFSGVSLGRAAGIHFIHTFALAQKTFSPTFFPSQCSRRATRVRRSIKRLSIYTNPFPMLSVVIIILKKREEIQAPTLGMEVRSC
jgi:hypothetical protein